MSDRATLLELLQRLSFEHRTVTLASGSASNFYFDCKQTALHPEGAALLGEALWATVLRIEEATGHTVEGVGGMTLGADPLATAVSLTARAHGRSIPAFIVRKTAKSHGTEDYLEGRRNLSEHARVVLLEDVVTTGGSTLRAAERARLGGLRPFGVATIIDRGAGGMDALTADGLHAEALFTPDDFR